MSAFNPRPAGGPAGLPARGVRFHRAHFPQKTGTRETYPPFFSGLLVLADDCCRVDLLHLSTVVKHDYFFSSGFFSSGFTSAGLGGSTPRSILSSGTAALRAATPASVTVVCHR